MSYIRKYKYTIIPEEAYTVIRNCPACGCKSVFVNTNNFRINANGNLIDIWLIYQCNKCKHTFNMTIYERIKAESLLPGHLERFMGNDKELALKYGTDKSLFVRNKAEIDWSGIKYQIIDTKTQKLVAEEQASFHSCDVIQIGNPYEIKVRADKIIAETLHITRNKVKQLEGTKRIEILTSHPGPNIDIILRGEIYTA